MTKKAQRQTSGKSQISLVATRLAEILPRYGLSGLKHAQAIEIAGIAAGYRTSNAAISAAAEIGPMPALAAVGTADAGGETLTVLLDPGSRRRFAVDAAFAANPPAGCVPTPYGTLAATPKEGTLAATAASAPLPPGYVGYIEHKHGHEFVYGATEDAMWAAAAKWCTDESPERYEDILGACDGDVPAAVTEFVSRDGFIHVDALGAGAHRAEPATAYAPVFSANISHRHGVDVVNGTSEEDLRDQVAAYCLANGHELPSDKPFPRPEGEMSSDDIIAHYFASVPDEFVEYNGETGSIPVPADQSAEVEALRRGMRDLIASFEENRSRWASGEAYQDEDRTCCDEAIASASALCGGGSSPEAKGRRDLHVAVVVHGSGTNTYTGPTEDDVRRQVAEWCREYWHDAGSPTADDPAELSDEEVVNDYFDGNDEESVTFGCDEGGGPQGLRTRIPRVVVTVRDGAAEVEAVDGTVDIAIIDFDLQETVSEEEVEDMTSFVRRRGDKATLDGLVEGHKAFLAEHFGEEEDDEN